MLTPGQLMDIICTEAVEFGGLQEVPEDKHGASQNYHSSKRDARGSNQLQQSSSMLEELPPIKCRLALREHPDGTLEWID